MKPKVTQDEHTMIHALARRFFWTDDMEVRIPWEQLQRLLSDAMVAHRLHEAHVRLDDSTPPIPSCELCEASIECDCGLQAEPDRPTWDETVVEEEDLSAVPVGTRRFLASWSGCLLEVVLLPGWPKASYYVNGQGLRLLSGRANSVREAKLIAEGMARDIEASIEAEEAANNERADSISSGLDVTVEGPRRIVEKLFGPVEPDPRYYVRGTMLLCPACLRSWTVTEEEEASCDSVAYCPHCREKLEPQQRNDTGDKNE